MHHDTQISQITLACTDRPLCDFFHLWCGGKASSFIYVAPVDHSLNPVPGQLTIYRNKLVFPQVRGVIV